MLKDYYLFLPPDRVVGPHGFNRLREWFSMKVIPYDCQVCEKGSEDWVYFAHLPKHDFLPVHTRESIDRRRVQIHPKARSKPASERQLAKIAFFDIPLVETSFTLGRAWEILDAFVSIDPSREEEYQQQPADEDQMEEMKELGVYAEGLSRHAAKELIEATNARLDEEEMEEERRAEEKAQQNEEREWNLIMLDERLNDEDVDELCHTGKFSDRTLKRVLIHLEEHLPAWKDISRFDLGDYIAKHRSAFD